MLNIDDLGTYFQGVAYVFDDDKGAPATGILIRTPNKDRQFALRLENLWAIDPRSGNPGNWDEIKQFFPGFVGASYVDARCSWDERSIRLEWKTDTGRAAESELPRSQAGEPSRLVPLDFGWAGFKDFVAGLRGRHLFRGQEGGWRLRTTFHRTGRADLLRFGREDIGSLHRRLSARTRHVFNLSLPDENGAFYNLVQHHGYPTPLLDWTYSPFVAAFFAYRKISRAIAAKAEPINRVRVFMLDERWRTEVKQVTAADRAFPHFSIAEFIAIENERAVPQQSVSAITNVDDIETYIQSVEKATGTGPYLTAIDLPVSERDAVFNDLTLMGVTAGSLFPGFDGTCEELKERNFNL